MIDDTVKSATHPIRQHSIEVGNLAYQCRQVGYSLRLLAALIDTKSYGVVYQAMISAERGRGGKRGPTTHDHKYWLEKNAQHLLGPMKARGITPRRWCSAYGIELHSLFDPPELADPVVMGFLQEDFPEAYGLKLPPYVHDYEEVQGFQHIKLKKKKLHIYKLSNGTKMISQSKGKALSMACKVQGLIYQAERLRVLLQKGQAEALAWVPKKVKLEPDQLTEEEKFAMARLRHQANIDDMIEDLSTIPKWYPSAEHVAKEKLLYSILIQQYEWTEERIKNAVQGVRLKKGKY
ncbi:hypothetical protein [Pelotalea chapellei]|uniref:Uncharacterized protein n=1 Tax=Pelotalea chapellei TaxID=44671 RepID=A0ABS5U3R1_9BACT|nr:hypothetical protein [Pelotalea chapellei]MBT1070310.1 hypothetical protein [Pelotalea chapellei]